MDNFVQIFDTTLRDGEQSPGATLTSAEKLEIARSLAMLGVDVMEAGFPAASPDDLEGVRRIATEIGNMPGPSGQPPIICGLARAVESDIDKAWQAVENAARPTLDSRCICRRRYEERIRSEDRCPGAGVIEHRGRDKRATWCS